MELLVGLIMELRLGMATYGTLMGDAMGLPPIYGADPWIYGAGRRRWSCCSCWWGWRRDLSWEWPLWGGDG